MLTSLVKFVINLPECFLSINLVSAFTNADSISTCISFLTSAATFIIITFAVYNEDPLTAKAKTINPGIINIKDFFCSIKSCFIAGSKRYAIDDVLAANSTVKNTETKILLIYFFV